MYEKLRLIYELLPSRPKVWKVFERHIKQEKKGNKQVLAILQNEPPVNKLTSDIHIYSNQKEDYNLYRGRFCGTAVLVRKLGHPGETRIAAFLKQIDTLGKSDYNANLVQYLTVETIVWRLFLVMEMCYIHLYNEMEMKLLNTSNETILRKCTDGMTYLHQKGIKHGLLRPWNVWLDYNDVVKLADYGLPRTASDSPWTNVS